jgi:aminopeptidase N
MRRKFLIFIAWYLLTANTMFAYTHADTLRGSNGRGRQWWDVLKYDLDIAFDTLHQSISGANTITFRVTAAPTDSMQIDLQAPMQLLDVTCAGDVEPFPPAKVAHDDNVWWVIGPFHRVHVGTTLSLRLTFSGSPRVAIDPPWDGGFSWTHDSTGKPWVAVSCQGLGASVWYPCKDYQGDEPDSGMRMAFTVPSNLQCISNGRLIDTSQMQAGNTRWRWQVRNPINNYDATFYIGDYAHWHDTLRGEKGRLDLDFYALQYHEAAARRQFAVVKSMLHCFEYWLGPYPFYEDGYKLVEAPYLGMEHQSAVAYGNEFKMGYLGMDRTFTGIGSKFDYIIVHESGHEWFGNSITTADIADMWVHEGITTYAEALFVECTQGKEEAERYSLGERLNIRNDAPIMGDYGVNKEGATDMYDKGASILYMIRKMMHDDEKFRQLLRGLSHTFYHKIVNTGEIEGYITEHSGLELQPFFNQYLRTDSIPVLRYYVANDSLFYRFDRIVPGFTLPLPLSGDHQDSIIHPTAVWQQMVWKGSKPVFSKDYLIKVVAER